MQGEGLPFQLKELMRHADIQETLPYAKPNPEATHKAINLLDVL